MSVRFFADHCIPNAVIQELQNAGHEVLRLREHIAVDSPDPIVITTARKLDCILISLNGDFADTINYPPGEYKGIISIQVRNHPEIIPQLMKKLMEYLSLYPDMQSYRGKLILIEAHRIRIRK